MFPRLHIVNSLCSLCPSRRVPKPPWKKLYKQPGVDGFQVSLMQRQDSPPTLSFWLLHYVYLYIFFIIYFDQILSMHTQFFANVNNWFLPFFNETIKIREIDKIAREMIFLNRKLFLCKDERYICKFTFHIYIMWCSQKRFANKMCAPLSSNLNNLIEDLIINDWNNKKIATLSMHRIFVK